MRKIFWFVLIVVLVESCYVGLTVDDRRKRESVKMMKKMQRVRRRATSGKLKAGVKYRIRQIKKRSVYYI